MFRDDRQLARVCDALCRVCRLDGMWTDEGPTERSIALLESGGGGLSSGERIVLLTAWSIWNGEGNNAIGDIIHRLDARNLRAIGTLLLAMASGRSSEFDLWLRDVDGTPDAERQVR